MARATAFYENCPATTILPDAEEIRGRFSAAGFDPEVEERFVPLVMIHGGESKDAWSLLCMLLDEVHAAAGNVQGLLESLLLMTPEFIDILVTDSEVAIPAEALLETYFNASHEH